MTGSPSWEQRVAQFWATASPAAPEDALERMRALAAERDDADGLYEWASVHDFLGREAEAIPLYEQALAAGLQPPRRPQAIIQLGSSLRNVGRAAEAVEMLAGLEPDPVTGDAARAFLALALHDAGRPDEALRVALRALAATLPLYGRAVTAYADDVGRRPLPGH
ncbi:tetratricopeptide repeat protein [Actinoplanes couchii]|uniref:Tetratrico peptide repeat group 5 domain-containing protein n=1 Tax=Actinoplanes couchii TaxID=403638 RepID=A0ABQ3XLY7_9ACTN|nr:tetratricopeptide repeat protein [Actinoplanes couchii]MDR6319261.1 tetratricopeptide (TPR) repeat protein [Actinoplanes couchii]GID59530.1 hypothetical protein Aco03nite_079340 [Actinoplanes couchii]